MNRVTIEITQAREGEPLRTVVRGDGLPVPGSEWERYINALLDSITRAAATMRNRPVIEGASRRVQ